jgi:citrate lyase subunit beta/citryl-CoA lyase
VLASAAAGIDPPVGPVSTNFRDLDALRTSTEALARLGYVGRACIHPAQAAVVNEVFTPSEESVASARALVEAYDAAVAAGQGVFTDESGRMVDLAVVRQARRTLSLAR